MLTISVAMCTYNGSRFLPDQLESIANQRRPPDELVVCDDKSSDNSPDLVEEFSRRVPFSVRLIRNDQNVGSTRNFERAVSLCRGAIVALADQDDIWYPDKLTMLEQAFLRSDKIVGAFSDADIVDDMGHPLQQRLWSSMGFDAGEQRRFQEDGWAVLLRHPVVTGATMAFRKEMSELLFPIPGRTIHDRWLSFLLAVAGPMTLLREPLMRYRIHRAQQVGVKPQGIKERFHLALQRNETFYAEEVALFRALSARLNRFSMELKNSDLVMAEINRKIRHLENRVGLRRANAARISEVFQEVRNRGYWKYSAGWQSVAKDLFLPERTTK